MSNVNTSRYFCNNCHSMFSNIHEICCINRPEQVIDKAWELGMSGVVLTDQDCISGTIKFLEAYKKKLEKEWKKSHSDENDELPSYEKMGEDLDFKVALGNEIFLSENDTTKDNYKGHHFYHYILIAKDAEGFRQIREISSEAWKRSWSVGAAMLVPTYSTDLFNYVKGGHLICTTADLNGYVARSVLNILSYGDDEFALNEEQKGFLRQAKEKLDGHLAAMESLFGKGNFFIELQPNGDKNSNQNKYNKYMIENYWGKYPFIVSTNAYYLDESLRKVHKAFLDSRPNKSGSLIDDSAYKYSYLMSAEEIKNMMGYVTDSQLDEMLLNTRKIKDMCSYYELSRKQVIAYVKYEHEAEYEQDLQIFEDVDEEKYPNFYYYVHTKDKADHYLAELIAHGYIQHYNKSWNTEVYYKRLEEELWTIKTVGEKIDQHMSDYFITMAKMIEIMWNDAGSIVGPARGSAGVMLINYLTGITEMNPVELNLPYVWRFMHPSRPDLPDIDVDTESDKRAKVFNEVQKYFKSLGGDVVNVCTFGTEKTKGAIQTAARGLGTDDDLVTYVTSLIPNERKQICAL